MRAAALALLLVALPALAEPYRPLPRVARRRPPAAAPRSVPAAIVQAPTGSATTAATETARETAIETTTTTATQTGTATQTETATQTGTETATETATATATATETATETETATGGPATLRVAPPEAERSRRAARLAVLLPGEVDEAGMIVVRDARGRIVEARSR